MNRRMPVAAAGLAVGLVAGTAVATPYDECGTFIPGFTANCVLFMPDDGTQNVWIGQLPAGYAVGDHARVMGNFVLCPSPCMAACVLDATVSGCPAPCPADFDGSGTLTVDDIFAFLQAWFAGSSAADFDHSGALTVTDIFAFLEAWFAGCP